MPGPGRPVAVALAPGDRERAADHLETLRHKWRLKAHEVAELLATTANVVSALKNARPSASSRMVGRALALDDSAIAGSGIIAERQRIADKQAANIAAMVAHARSFEQPAEPTPDKPRAADPDDDIPFV